MDIEEEVEAKDTESTGVGGWHQRDGRGGRERVGG
jgi:hypothetical protein